LTAIDFNLPALQLRLRLVVTKRRRFDFGVFPQRKPRIPLAPWKTQLLSAQKLFPLITIRREAISNEVCYIGKVVSVTDKTFALYDIDTGAESREY
jgi:hypothetical protein